MHKIFSLVSFILSIFASKYLFGDCRGKTDIGPAYVHLDVLNFGKTVKTMDMAAIKVDSNYLIHKGLCIKPGVLYGSNRGSLLTVSMGLGYALPYKRWCFTPSAGVFFTKVKTTVPIEFFGFKVKAKEQFTSWSSYLSFEIFYTIAKNWRTGFQYQYAWSRSHTTIKGFGSDKTNAKGPSYAWILERDLSDHWSINFGAAYNVSLTREKHGLRGYGAKLGIAYWL